MSKNKKSNVNILDRFGSHRYNSSVWVNPSQRVSLPLSFVLVSLHTVYFYMSMSLPDCMPRNLPVSNKRDLKENSCVSY